MNNPTKTPIRADVPPLLDGPYKNDNMEEWFLICLAWFAGFITCYIFMTL